ALRVKQAVRPEGGLDADLAVAREGLDGGELHLPAGGPFRADLPEERWVERLPGDRLLRPIVSLHDGRDGEVQGRLAGKVARRADREPELVALFLERDPVEVEAIRRLALFRVLGRGERGEQEPRRENLRHRRPTERC